MGIEPQEALIGSEVLLYKYILRVKMPVFPQKTMVEMSIFLLALGQKSPKSGRKKQIAVKIPNIHRVVLTVLVE